jgi:hypothetical protein
MKVLRSDLRTYIPFLGANFVNVFENSKVFRLGSVDLEFLWFAKIIIIIIILLS